MQPQKSFHPSNLPISILYIPTFRSNGCLWIRKVTPLNGTGSTTATSTESRLSNVFEKKWQLIPFDQMIVQGFTVSDRLSLFNNLIFFIIKICLLNVRKKAIYICLSKMTVPYIWLTDNQLQVSLLNSFFSIISNKGCPSCHDGS